MSTNNTHSYTNKGIHSEKYPVTIKCGKCHSQFRAYGIGPILMSGTYKYCIQCGSNRVSCIIDMDQDYWEVLSFSFNISVEAIKHIYDLWEPVNNVPTFAQHVKETRKMMKALKKLND